MLQSSITKLFEDNASVKLFLMVIPVCIGSPLDQLSLMALKRDPHTLVVQVEE